MAHYRHSEWADYERGLVDDAAAEAMGRHLASGCRRCCTAAASIRAALRVAEADSRQALPDGMVRSVKALFAVQRAEQATLPRRLELRLIADSRLEPAPAGVRGPGYGRRLTYGAEGLELGLELQALPGSDRVSLGGELLHYERGHLAEVPAYLICGEEIVDQATTDPLGSFHLAAEVRQRLRLCLFLEDSRLIELDLDPPTASGGEWVVKPSERSS